MKKFFKIYIKLNKNKILIKNKNNIIFNYIINKNINSNNSFNINTYLFILKLLRQLGLIKIS